MSISHSYQLPSLFTHTIQKNLSTDDAAAEQSPFMVMFWWILGELFEDYDINFFFLISSYFTGIILLTVALFVSARMGIYQEVLYKKHGKYSHEALYITVMIFLANIQLILIECFHFPLHSIYCHYPVFCYCTATFGNTFKLLMPVSQ